MQKDIITRLQLALPNAREWIDDYIRQHSGRGKILSSMGFDKLPRHFPDDLLDSTEVVMVPRVEFPPVDRFGLPEFASIQQMRFAGITFHKTFFVQQGRISESLYFHEMVHVVQWDQLGFDNFLMAYGIGLLHHGYEASPLEEMAYSLQRQFDSNALPSDVTGFIQEQTDAIWTRVLPLVEGATGA